MFFFQSNQSHIITHWVGGMHEALIILTSGWVEKHNDLAGVKQGKPVCKPSMANFKSSKQAFDNFGGFAPLEPAACYNFS